MEIMQGLLAVIGILLFAVFLRLGAILSALVTTSAESLKELKEIAFQLKLRNSS